MVNNKITRRTFLRSSVLAGAGLCLGGKVFSAVARQEDRNRPNIDRLANQGCYGTATSMP